MKKLNEIIEKIETYQLDFFDSVDLKKEGVDKLTKKELFELISFLNKKMIESTDWWEGG